MDTQKVDVLLLSFADKLTPMALQTIRQRLLEADESKLTLLQGIELKTPMTSFWFNFFLGGLGAEYFYLGSTGLGIAKLLTCGGCGIWNIINLFTITGKTREVNFQKIMMML